MHTLGQLEKKQIGLRLPQYLIEEIDELTEQFALNRTDIVTEALRSYLNEQKTRMLYESFDRPVKAMMAGELPEITLGELIDELDHPTHP